MVNLFSKYIHILAIIYGTIYRVAKCVIVTGLSSPALHYSVPSTLYCSFKTFFFLLFLEFCTSHKHTHTHTKFTHKIWSCSYVTFIFLWLMLSLHKCDGSAGDTTGTNFLPVEKLASLFTHCCHESPLASLWRRWSFSSSLPVTVKCSPLF